MPNRPDSQRSFLAASIGATDCARSDSARATGLLRDSLSIGTPWFTEALTLLKWLGMVYTPFVPSVSSSDSSVMSPPFSKRLTSQWIRCAG